MYYNYIKVELGEYIMEFNYNGLWKILIDKNMKKKDLIETTGISPTTISKMTRGEAISLSVLGKICKSLNVDIGDVVNLIKTDVEDK
ncbi:helix-turn-helix domain-containing protein [Streptococcus suis]|uniref:helix-turn-helix domain-containing protein n=1 Tax=Streptococcus suis TaxID=1307 RepID=UPI003F81FF7E